MMFQQFLRICEKESLSPQLIKIDKALGQPS